MNLQPIRTFIHRERPAFLGLAAVTAVCAAVLGVVLALGDQRTFEIVASNPGEGRTVSSTANSISLTFSNEARRDAVEESFRVDPPVNGVPRWRGQTFEYILREPLEPGAYTVSLDAGTLGRGSERLRTDFSMTFEVRAPGIAVVESLGDEGERLVEVRADDTRELARGLRILDYEISPDSSRLAVIVESEPEQSRLELVDIDTGERQVVVDDPDVDVATVSWAADSQALLAVRRDTLPDGGQGVPRAWLLRLSGEFVSPIDPDGEPTLAPRWSPDAQMIMYSAPATGRLVVLNLGTQEERNLGQPRSSAFVWSPDSSKVAFEGVPDTVGSQPIQPIRVQSLDGELDLVIGDEGESHSLPRFLDDDVVMGLRRNIGEDSSGTDLLFHSVEDANLLRAIELTPGADLVLDWDLAPTRQEVVYTVQAGNSISTIVLDLETGQREPVEPAGRRASWIP